MLIFIGKVYNPSQQGCKPDQPALGWKWRLDTSQWKR